MTTVRIAALVAIAAALLAGCAGGVKTSERPCDPNCYSQRTISSIRM